MLENNKAFSSFSVDDIEKARKFYQDTIGLKVKTAPMGPYEFLELHIKGVMPIVVYPKPNHEAATFTVLNFEVDDIDQTVEELGSRGVKFEHYDTGEMKTDDKGIARSNGYGPDIAWFKDPAGNFISVLKQG